ncbi:membrane protein SmpA [Rhodomicrobium udaipurense JA643]|jgi:outer membrane protein assembly factor BamE (lipoprotein component of BamABCDE complex)|uniref:Outer membrane protein assembly factor BamE n=1 Tax=Rhodomicrobium udaipurense TaxID=1202716 RepID=A0A8I1KIE8_9HYPH|nr:outer membrane protein assembly factor BamE [Rhodomicrobium udaipurense]KAI94809.1 membrane protein SmpA [Rhodomicrobium udaipurense JA643]MBJ7544645.1 outer membrane protein assembly factor BamE [Rhodomicrobium udaipurense]
MSNQSSKDFGRKRLRAKALVRAVAMSSALAAACFTLPGCAGNVIKQGHQFQDEDLNQVRVGMSKDEVVLALGTPDTQSAIAGGTYYYVSQTAQQQMAFMKPEVIDRRVVAVYFDKKDKVEQIANYGLKDGKVFDFIRRETPVYTRDQGMLKEIFRNIGMGPAIPGVQK